MYTLAYTLTVRKSLGVLWLNVDPILGANQDDCRFDG